jgi:hypothetical protein
MKITTFLVALVLALPVAGGIGALFPAAASAQDMSETDARQELDSALKETGASADTARAARGLFDKLIRAQVSPEDSLIISTYFLEEPAKIKDVTTFADQQIGAGVKGDDLTRKIAKRFNMED